MPKPAASKLSVLIIDDDPVFRDLLKMTLEKTDGSKVTACGNARTALEFLKHGAQEIQLILLDLDMPDMNGVAFLQSIRNSGDRKLADMPVVIVTGHDSEKVKQGMEPFGIHGFLGKPPDMKKLVEVLNSIRQPGH
jgi:CheY-like chemotaxis protein